MCHEFLHYSFWVTLINFKVFPEMCTMFGEDMRNLMTLKFLDIKNYKTSH